MILVTNSWRLWMVGMAASLAIFAVVYFTVIQPNENTANQALKSGLQQSQQVLNQAQKQIASESGQASATSGSVQRTAGASGQATGAAGTAEKVLSRAQKLTACVAAAGTDPTRLEACQAKYAN